VEKEGGALHNAHPLHTPNGSSAPKGRRLTEGEAREVQKLIGEGMESSFARAAVLDEEVEF
jgi:hypothetical protein